MKDRWLRDSETQLFLKRLLETFPAREQAISATSWDQLARLKGRNDVLSWVENYCSPREDS